MANLQIKNLNIHYDDFHAVKGVNINVKDSEIVSLLGPSGCGKTSILRAIAGFIEPSKGKIVLEGKDITHLPPQKRNMGMIFQSYALWPHMSVMDNIGYGLKIRDVPKEEREKRVMDLVRQVQLEGQENKFPGQLSGGQQQRVSLARALAIEPGVLLCDEPLSNLDFKLRVELRTEIRDIAKKFGVTVVYVTHDQTEALAISDKIAVMSAGNIIQENTPFEIYDNPNHAFVGKFVGENNLLSGTIKSIQDKDITVELTSGDLITAKQSNLYSTDKKIKALENQLVEIPDPNIGDEVEMIIRYDKLAITDSQNENILKGKLKHKAFMGSFLQIEIELNDGTSVTANISKNLTDLTKIKSGNSLNFVVNNQSPLLFVPNGARL